MRMHFLTSSSEKTGAGDFVGNETFVGSDATVIIMGMKDTERRPADMTESTASREGGCALSWVRVSREVRDY